MTDTSPPFRVFFISQVKEQLQQLTEKARQLRMASVPTQALRQIVDNLHQQPLDWGEPEFATRHPPGIVCHAILDPLAVRYVVYPEDHLVCCLAVTALSRSPLSRNE
jgi:hypothetical protein